ncbi:MAG: malonyl-CoA/methylmalonyl-CoA synthetase [Gammaproteobacteria bacterium]|nr:malonyl-CoA/methylmalonyl-CoA synthetase [Gammaproteobacteria bacterium]
MSSVLDPADWVDAAARNHPHQLFLDTPTGRQLSYAALRQASGRYASALMRRGVVPGERVAVQVDKSVEAVLLYVACLRMGAVFVPINVANTPNEVDYFLRDSQPRIAVIRPDDRVSLEPLAARAGVPQLETLGAQGEGSFVDLSLQSDEDPELAHGAGGNSPAAIVYTSGTTGRSKCATLTRANLASNAAALVEAWRFTASDVLLHTLPLFHVHGLFAAINTVLASGSSLMLLPKFDAASALKYLPQATVYMGVPTHYTRLLQESGLNREVASGARLFVSGSAPLLMETHREFLQRTGHAILERYGMTETLMNTSNPYYGLRKPGSVGLPLRGIAVRVTGAAGAVESSAETTGAIEVTGPNVFAGYWRAPDKTRGEFTADGWFKTGDLGRIDRDGYLHIVGRAKDLVISGGYNVYPKEVEMELDALPGVAESAVFGVPHPDFGEGVTAVVVPQATWVMSEEDIIRTLQTRLARYKVPKRVLFIEELPRNTMGKVQKNMLRTAYASLYGAG